MTNRSFTRGSTLEDAWTRPGDGRSASADGTTGRAGPGGSDGTQPTVLVAEDDAHLLALYESVLSGDYRVRTAADGDEALEIVGPDIDVVLLDRDMPTVSGVEVIESLRAAGHPCRIAMITGVVPDVDIIDLGLDDYLVKPVSVSELSSVVERLVSLSRYDREIRELHALASKKAALEAHRSSTDLAEEPRYRDLRSDLAALRERLDSRRLDHDSLPPSTVFDDLSGERAGDP